MRPLAAVVGLAVLSALGIAALRVDRSRRVQVAGF